MRSRPKIAFVIPLLSSGGAERATVSVASAIDPERYEPVIVLQSSGPRTYLPADHVRVVEVGAPRTHSALLPLTRVLRAERPDLVYAVLPHLALLSAAAVRTMRRPRPALAIGVQNNLGAELPEWSNGELLRRLTPWVYRQAGAVVVASRGLGDEAARDFGAHDEAVHVIPNAVDVESIRASAQEQVPHRWLDDPDLRTAVAIGRLTPQKNYPMLLDAFARVAADDPALRLLILGEGELRDELSQRIVADPQLADRVELAGSVANPFGYLARADVFVSSSDYEGFGMVHLEALSVGAPVVATDCDFGPAEILGQGRFGTLTPVGSASALADALRAMLADPARRAELREAGPRRADDFRIERLAPRFDALFDELIAARR